MVYEIAKRMCHVRSAIYRKSKPIRYWKNHPIPLDARISEEDKLANDWEEYAPREDDNCSLFMYND
jgi:hypothetical protein